VTGQSVVETGGTLHSPRVALFAHTAIVHPDNAVITPSVPLVPTLARARFWSTQYFGTVQSVREDDVGSASVHVRNPAGNTINIVVVGLSTIGVTKDKTKGDNAPASG